MNTPLLGSEAAQPGGAANPLGAAPLTSGTIPALPAALSQETVSISDEGKTRQQAMQSQLSLLQQMRETANSQGASLRKSAARAKISDAEEADGHAAQHVGRAEPAHGQGPDRPAQADRPGTQAGGIGAG